MLPHSSTVHDTIISLGYCLYGVSVHALPGMGFLCVPGTDSGSTMTLTRIARAVTEDEGRN